MDKNCVITMAQIRMCKANYSKSGYTTFFLSRGLHIGFELMDTIKARNRTKNKVPLS